MIFFAELDGGFQILEEYVPRILYYSQHNGYRHDKLSCFICINVFSITFLSLEKGSTNIFVKGQIVNILGFLCHTVAALPLGSAMTVWKQPRTVCRQMHEAVFQHNFVTAAI